MLDRARGRAHLEQLSVEVSVDASGAASGEASVEVSRPTLPPHLTAAAARSNGARTKKDERTSRA